VRGSFFFPCSILAEIRPVLRSDTADKITLGRFSRRASVGAMGAVSMRCVDRAYTCLGERCQEKNACSMQACGSAGNPEDWGKSTAAEGLGACEGVGHWRRRPKIGQKWSVDTARRLLIITCTYGIGRWCRRTSNPLPSRLGDVH
jgi:hypothetical protein